MATDEHVLRSLSAVENRIKLLTAAARADDVVHAASDYLASWSSERIALLQKIDGGWGTFDSQEQPISIHDVGHVAQISTLLSNHCIALKDAGIEPTSEILELDLYFAVAKQMAESFIASRARVRTGTTRSTGYRYWSDNDAKAA